MIGDLYRYGFSFAEKRLLAKLIIQYVLEVS